MIKTGSTIRTRICLSPPVRVALFNLHRPTTQITSWMSLLFGILTVINCVAGLCIRNVRITISSVRMRVACVLEQHIRKHMFHWDFEWWQTRALYGFEFVNYKYWHNRNKKLYTYTYSSMLKQWHKSLCISCNQLLSDGK